MQARKPQANKIAKSIHAASTDSTIANLESRATTASATAGPAVGVRTGKKFTGQYLYNRFVEADKAETSKLDIVRSMVDALDVDDFKKIIADFVAIPAGYRDNAIKDAKAGAGYDANKPSAEIAGHMARLKTAQNHQTVMRLSFGALKFAADKLAEFGYDNTTGYQVMAVISRKALSAKGIKWDGTKILNETEAQRKAATKAETKALEHVMESIPRDDGETMTHYLARCAGKVQEQLAADNVEREQKMVLDLIKRVRKLAGPMLDDVMDGILRGEGQVEPEQEQGLNPETAQAAAAVAVKH